MIEIDEAGIARTRRRLGDEGTTFLLLKSSQKVTGHELDDATPADDGESSTNGGWFATPRGWMLLLEGLDADVDSWIDHLATSLDAAGVSGTLTGAPVVGVPTWAQKMSASRRLSASLLYRVTSRDNLRLRSWAHQPETHEAVTRTALDWVDSHSPQLKTYYDDAGFWADRTTARRNLLRDLAQDGNAIVVGYDRDRADVRASMTSNPSALFLSSESADVLWQDTAAELRDALIHTNLEPVVLGFVGYRDVGYYQSVHGPDRPYDAWSWRHHPEIWDEYVLAPQGIQVLTDRHLQHASDLSGWMTTRVDDHHYLVEARDLEPWLGRSTRMQDDIDADVMAQALRDFGDMVFTHERAAALGIHETMPS